MIREYKAVYGAEWIKNFQEENPDFSFIVDLVANYDEPTAFTMLEKHVDNVIDDYDLSFVESFLAKSAASAALSQNRQNVFAAHRLLKAKIDKPRF